MISSRAAQVSRHVGKKIQLSRGLPIRGFMPRFGSLPKRQFHNYGDPVPEHQFTPAEDTMLDATAWFVAFALCYTPPAMEPYEDEDEDSSFKKQARDDDRNHRDNDN